MSCFIPVATALRKSFLSPLKLSTPHPARSDDVIAAIEKDLKMFRHTATEKCKYEEWLGFRSLVTADLTTSTFRNEASLKPVDKEMNSDRVLFGSYAFALHFCGLRPDQLSHLRGLKMAQNKICYIFPGAICRSTDAIAPPGVVLGRSWPGAYRMMPWELPNQQSADGATAEIQNRNQDTAKAIDVSGERLTVREWPVSIFDITKSSVHDPMSEWDACSGYWAQTDKYQNGIIRFTFPVIAFGATYDLQKLSEVHVVLT